MLAAWTALRSPRSRPTRGRTAHEVNTYVARVSRRARRARAPRAHRGPVAVERRSCATTRQAVRAGRRRCRRPARCACWPSARRCRRCPAARRAGAADRRRAHDRGALERARRSTSATCTSRSRRSVAAHGAAPLARAERRAPSTRRPSASSPRRSRARSCSSSSAASTRAPPPSARRATCCARFFPGEYAIVAPGADPLERRARDDDGPVRIAFVDAGGARAPCGCSCARCAAWTPTLPWEARSCSAERGPSSSTPLRADAARARALRRPRREDARWPRADVLVAASDGVAPGARRSIARAQRRRRRPGRLAPGGLRGGPARRRGGLLFEPSDVETLAAQLAAPDRRRASCASACARRRAAARRGARSPTSSRRSTRALAARRHDAAATPSVAARARRAGALDRRRPAHAHRPQPRLRDAGRGAAGHRARPGPGRDRGDRPQRGLRRARGRRQGRGLRRQGHRRRGGQDRAPGRGHRPLPDGEDPARHDAGRDGRRDQAARAASSTCPIRSTACTPCPTTSTCSTIVEDVDAIEVYNPRVAIGSFNEEAARFAAKYRISAGAGSDAHVAQGLGSVRVRMRDFDGPRGVPRVAARGRDHHQAVEPALRAGAEVPRDEGHAAGRARAPARAPRAARDAQAVMQAQGRPADPSKPAGPMPATDDEIREKYLERAIRELNALTRELQSCEHCPRGNLMPVLGSGHPQADVFLLKHAPRRERDRGGRRLLRAQRHGADEVAQAAAASTRSPSTGRCA